jgi:hypothetical protein
LFLRLEGHNLSLDDETHGATMMALQGDIKWRLSSSTSCLCGPLADMCYVPEKDTSKEIKCYRSAAIINRDGWYNVELIEYPTYYKSQFHLKYILLLHCFLSG